MHNAVESDTGKIGTITDFCKHIGMSRQNYYATHKRRKKQEIEENLILELVHEKRNKHPRMGTRKLYHLLDNEFRRNGISIGRDRFFDLLRKNKMLIEKKKSKPKTTNSRHCLPVFYNLVKDMDINAPNQAWCSDLTYISTMEGFMYASLITDMYSHKLVGVYIGDSLESIGCLKALEMALNDLPKGLQPVHHSDRGTQYCCHEYVKKLQDSGLSISMTEINHCYENAMAERVNGILKDEYELDHLFKSKTHAITAFYNAVALYNNERPHLSLNYGIPGKIHDCGKAA